MTTSTTASAMTRTTDWSGQPPVRVSTSAASVLEAVKTYGRGDQQVRALDGVSVDFEHGRFTAIMGPSGSGKSTLMHMRRRSRHAHVRLGPDRRHRPRRASTTADSPQLRRDRIGFIFQAFNLVPTLTAAENITLPATLAGRKPDAAWFDHVVDTVGLATDSRHRPSELSGGQQQRVAVARALVAPAADHLRRRADGQPRLAHRRRDPRRSCALRCASSARRS